MTPHVTESTMITHYLVLCWVVEDVIHTPVLQQHGHKEQTGSNTPAPTPNLHQQSRQAGTSRCDLRKALNEILYLYYASLQRNTMAYSIIIYMDAPVLYMTQMCINLISYVQLSIVYTLNPQHHYTVQSHVSSLHRARWQQWGPPLVWPSLPQICTTLWHRPQ